MCRLIVCAAMAIAVIPFVSEPLLSAAVGAFVYRGVERQLRTSFLERGLMGEMAARDGLTGLKNRGAFDEHFPRLWQQGLRDRRSIAVARRASVPPSFIRRSRRGRTRSAT